jgi:Reverse transcriptase (RNA-dependent DNA polymerase)
VNARWHNTISIWVTDYGTRQGGILSPCFFNRYVHDLPLSISSTKCGCNINGTLVNIFAIADDIVLFASSSHALQLLLDRCILESEAVSIDIMCNIKKTVRMIFAPKCRSIVMATRFPHFKLFGY